ncbi:hypothetical protein [Corynebacterium pyruviciproducens]|nr:hypothetical protein [Corynebacterium pyruviciproducens]
MKLSEQEANDLRTWLVVDYIEEIRQAESADTAMVKAYRTMRANKMLPTPPTTKAPEGLTVPGELYTPVNDFVYITGDLVLVDGRILQAQAIIMPPVDFTADKWLDVTGLYQHAPENEEA